MVTIVNDYYTPSNTYSMYEGMSISDAANYMVLECNNAIHDLEMDILLTEHAYLLENGYEIEYINEEGEATKQGNGVIAKILQTIDKFIKFIKELWNKLITTISEKLSMVVASFVKLGLNQKKVKEVEGVIDVNQVKITLSATPKFGIAELPSKAAELLSSNIMMKALNAASSGNYGIYDEYVDNAQSDVLINSDVLNTAADVVFNYRKHINTIKTTQKECIKVLEEKKKELKNSKNKNVNPDTISGMMNDINKQLKWNSNVSKDLVRIVNLMFTNGVKIVKKALSTYNTKTKKIN